MRRRSGITTVLLVLFGIFFLFVLIIGGCAYSGYNKAIRLDEEVGAGWAQVENQLQRRFDLIPNLVETVKGYAGHEKDIIANVTESRTKYFSAGNRQEKVAAANGFERALSRLLVLQERYPDLKAQQSFQNLQFELAGTENRLAVERQRYNEAVRDLNKYCRSLLGRTFSGWANVEPAEYFEVKEETKETPKVDFGG